jgi:hypothetical protein
MMMMMMMMILSPYFTAVFFCTSLNSCFSGTLPGIFRMILRWFQVPLLLLVSRLFLHSTCALFLL